MQTSTAAAALAPRRGLLVPRAFQGEGSSARGSPVQQRARVKFTLGQQTRFGEQIGVVGSFNGWDPLKPLKLECSEGALWGGEADLPVGEAVEYKYVLLSEQNHNVTWQPGGNLTLRLEDGTQSVLVLDDWLGQTHEVKPADLATPAAVAEEEASAPADVSSASAAVAAVEEAEAPAFVAVDSEDAPGLEVVAPELPAAVAAAAAVAEEPEEQAAASELTAVLADPAEAATELAPAPNAAVAAASEAPAERLAFRILAPTAEESWKDVLAVANESFAQVAEEEAAAAAAAEEAAAEEATAVTEAVAAVEEPTVAEPALPAAAAVEEAPVAVAEPAAAAKAPAAQLNLTNGAPPAPLAAEKAPVLAVAAPVASPKQSGLLRCLALFARLVLVASLIVAAVISFLRSPWAAARFTFLAL